MKTYAVRAESLRRSRIKGGENVLLTIFEAVTQFVFAHNRAARTIKDAVPQRSQERANTDIIRTLRDESQKNVRGAKQFLTLVEETYPDLISTSRTRLATHLVLQHRLEFISKFTKYGLLTSREAQLLQGAVHKAEVSLRLSKKAIPRPPFEDLVHKCPLFKLVRDESFDRLWEESEQKEFPDSGEIDPCGAIVADLTCSALGS